MSMQKWHELGPFTFFDVETTGFSPVNDRIIEIAAVRVELDGTTSEWSTLVNPRREIPQKITRITGIGSAMVNEAPTFSRIGNTFTDLARNSTLIAHNARFDLAFLQESLSRCGLQLWQGKTMDSMTLAKQTYSGLPSYSLQSLRAALQLESAGDDAHRALADARLTVKLVAKIFSTLLERGN